MKQQKEGFTKYEIARIIGARALQIAMDAPLLLNLSEEDLKELKYDSLSIAEKELEEGVLPIDINKPTPRKKKDKLVPVKEDDVTDDELEEKEREESKEIAENPEEYSAVDEDEDSVLEEKPSSSEEYE